MAEIPVGLCQCGCKGRTNATKRFLKGHSVRGTRKPLHERLEDYLYPDPNSGCWLFAGPTFSNGYGQISVNGKPEEAHRLAWVLSGRELPPLPMILRHKCDMRICCNVDHLLTGTKKDNQMDMARRFRGRKGSLPCGVKKNHKRFMARGIAGRYLGTYDTIEQAAAVAKADRLSHA